MTFLAPYMLWGSLAAGIPIALHFFFRSRYRTVPWAAMKFLLTSVEQTSRRLRFQELLLLLLRVALLVLLALALARPMSSVVRGAGGGEAVDAVFVFDTSYSMGGADGSRTRMRRAQDSALSIIDQLPPHSTVQIVACADRSQVLGPDAPADLSRARDLIAELRPTSLATDLSWGIADAAGLLERAQASNKELYIFSDMQKLGWQRQAGKIRELLDNVKERALVTVVQCGRQPLKNAAIVDIVPQTGVPRPGERVGYAVLVRNTGSEPLTNVELALTVDGSGKHGSSATIDTLAGGETRSLTLTGLMDKPGLRRLSAAIKHDDVPGDNQFDHIVRVREQVQMLVVEGSPNRDNPDLTVSFYLTSALLPALESDRDKYFLQPRQTSSRLASPALLARRDLCVLVNCAVTPDPGRSVEVLPSDFVDELARFVRQGHGLIVFAGDNVDALAYQRILGDKHDLLPLPIKGLQEFPAAKPLTIDRDSFQVPAFARFRSDDYYKGFADVEVLKAMDLAEPLAGEEGGVIVMSGADLPAGTRKEDIEKLFTPWGKVVQVEILKPPPATLQDKKRRADAAPLELRRESGEGSDKDLARIELAAGADRALSRLKDEEFLGHKLRVREEPRSRAVVVARYSNGSPAVVTRKVGAGEVLFITTSADPGFTKDSLEPTWTDWPLRLNLYVPFIDVAVNYLLHGQSQNLNTVAGQTLTWQPDERQTQAYSLQRPDGNEVRLGLPQDVDGRPRLTITNLPHAGIYYLTKTKASTQESKESEQIDGVPLAVVADLRESEDLENLPAPQLIDLLGFEPQFLFAGTVQAQETGADRLNREWTVWILALILMFAVCESLLAWWCGRTW